MGTNGERGRSRFWKRRRSGDEPADQQQLEIPLERPASADEEFLEQMRAAIEAAAPHHEPESPRDLAALADLVTYQQTGEARVPHVSVPTGAWNTLASESVARGLRRLETPGRDEALFKMALIEPTHLSAVLMTAAAALVLKTGDVAPWRHRAHSEHHDPRPIPGEEKAGVMIGMAFTGPCEPVITPLADPQWFQLDGVDLIVHSHLYDALIVRVPEPNARATCYLVPVHSDKGRPNGIEVLRLFGKPGTAPQAFAEAKLDGSRAVRIGPAGVGDDLLEPAIARLRTDAAIIGAAQMRVAVDALAEGLERRKGADVFHRLLVSDIEAVVAREMAFAASRETAGPVLGELALVVAQHWVRSRSEAIIPDAAAIVHLEETARPGLTFTSPLLPLWGATPVVLRAEFARLVKQGRLEVFLEACAKKPASTPLAATFRWLLELALDAEAPIRDRLEATSLLWAASILVDLGRIDAAASLLGADAVPIQRSELVQARRSAAEKATNPGPEDSGRLVVDLRSVDSPIGVPTSLDLGYS